MPGGYGTDEESTPWGSAGASYVSPGQSSSPHQPGGGSTNQGGSNALADAINIANAAPPQLSFSQDLQNQANLAIAQENMRRGIGKYAGQFPEYDMDQPMATGFGSVFGSSTGSTASSETVQDVLNFMIDDQIQQMKDETGRQNLSDAETDLAIAKAYDTYYPGYMDYKYGEGDIPVNLMDIEKGLPLPGHQLIGDLRSPSFDQRWSGMDDWDYKYYGDYGGGRPETASMTDPKWWSQDVAPTTPTSFADLQRIYGKEFGEERMAAPHAWGIEPFSETIIEGAY